MYGHHSTGRCDGGALRTGLQPGEQGYEACDDGNADGLDRCNNVYVDLGWRWARRLDGTIEFADPELDALAVDHPMNQPQVAVARVSRRACTQYQRHQRFVAIDSDGQVLGSNCLGLPSPFADVHVVYDGAHGRAQSLSPDGTHAVVEGGFFHFRSNSFYSAMHERFMVNDHQYMDVNVQMHFERTAEDRSVYVGTYYPGGVPSDVEVYARYEGSQPGEFIPIQGIRSLMKGISTCLVDAQRSIYCGISADEWGLGLDGGGGSTFVLGLVEPRSN